MVDVIRARWSAHEVSRKYVSLPYTCQLLYWCLLILVLTVAGLLLHSAVHYCFQVCTAKSLGTLLRLYHGHVCVCAARVDHSKHHGLLRNCFLYIDERYVKCPCRLKTWLFTMKLHPQEVAFIVDLAQMERTMPCMCSHEVNCLNRLSHHTVAQKSNKFFFFSIPVIMPVPWIK